MTNIFKDSRRDLRERAFQTLFALEFGGEALEQAHFAYTYDKPIDEETEVDVPAFLLSLVKASVKSWLNLIVKLKKN